MSRNAKRVKFDAVDLQAVAAQGKLHFQYKILLFLSHHCSGTSQIPESDDIHSHFHWFKRQTQSEK